MSTKAAQPEPDHEQFTRLWVEAQPVVAAYINALVPDFQEAEDLLQDVAVILLRKFSEYHSDRPFIGWAIGFAKFEILMSRRRHARTPLSFEPDLTNRLTGIYEELAPELENRSRALRDCLGSIKGRAAELLRLRYEESLKPKRIADQLGLAVIAVRVTLSRLRASLRDCIERKLNLENVQR